MAEGRIPREQTSPFSEPADLFSWQLTTLAPLKFSSSAARSRHAGLETGEIAEADRVFCATGNAGTEGCRDTFRFPHDLPQLARFPRRTYRSIVGGPDDAPLRNVDLFEQKGCVFSDRTKEQRDWKLRKFCQGMMSAEKIPTAQARTFSSSGEALNYCEEVALPVVIKADGLALGKGVVIADNRGSAQQAVRSIMEERVFGEAGRRIIIEECLRGTECSVHALVSGNLFACSQRARSKARVDGQGRTRRMGAGHARPTIGTRSANANALDHAAVARGAKEKWTSFAVFFYRG